MVGKNATQTDGVARYLLRLKSFLSKPMMITERRSGQGKNKEKKLPATEIAGRGPVKKKKDKSLSWSRGGTKL